jgi:malate/lactate dehydrogenase
VIVVAGQGQMLGMTRIDLMNNNANIIRSIVKESLETPYTANSWWEPIPLI